MECGKLGSPRQFSDWAMGLTSNGLFPDRGKRLYSSQKHLDQLWELTLLIMWATEVLLLKSVKDH
jgi:hypothetical protein